jgi:hypothetical protein
MESPAPRRRSTRGSTTPAGSRSRASGRRRVHGHSRQSLPETALTILVASATTLRPPGPRASLSEGPGGAGRYDGRGPTPADARPRAERHPGEPARQPRRHPGDPTRPPAARDPACSRTDRRHRRPRRSRSLRRGVARGRTPRPPARPLTATPSGRRACTRLRRRRSAPTVTALDRVVRTRRGGRTRVRPVAARSVVRITTLVDQWAAVADQFRRLETAAVIGRFERA